MTKKRTRLENDGPPPDRNPKKIQRFPAKAVVQPTRIETTKKANRTGGCLRYRWIPHPTRSRRAVGPVLGMTKEARAKRSPDTLTLSTATAYATAYQTPRISSVIADRKSTRLNSSHSQISYAVFCLKKKKTTHISSLVIEIAHLHNQ